MGRSTRKVIGLTGRSIRRILCARGVVSISGRGSVAIGIFSWRHGGGVVFQGLLLPRSSCARAAGVGLERRWKRLELVDRLTGLPVLRPSVS